MEMLSICLQAGQTTQPVSLVQTALVGFGLLMAIVSTVMFKKWYKAKEAKNISKDLKNEET